MNAQKFYDAIEENTVIDEDFLKKLYGYSLYDKEFLISCMQKFIDYGRSRVSNIFTLYIVFEKKADNEKLAPTAKWLVEQIDKEFERQVKEYEEKKGAALDGTNTGRKETVFRGFPQDW